MSNERVVWFITRPERDPVFHADAMIVLNKVTENFKLKWKGNRDLHKAFEAALANEGLKRMSISKDGSGGRTWAALLRTFAYCYMNSEGFLVPTKSGIALINNQDVRENTSKQLLTLQIPNSYFLSSGFRPKYSNDFSIQPIRFLVKLCLEKELHFFLTKEEITYFALSARKNTDLTLVKNKILEFRKLSDTEKEIQKNLLASKLDHRSRTDSVARNFETAHSDVAHTLMLAADYTKFITYERGKFIRFSKDISLEEAIEEIDMLDNRYPFSKRYLIDLEFMAEHNGLDCKRFKASSLKNIAPATNQAKYMIKAEKILKNKLSTLINPTEDDYFNLLLEELGKSQAKNIAPILLEKYSPETLLNSFAEKYLNPESNLDFEDLTGSLFEKIGFDVEMRPNHKYEESTQIEILLKYGDNKFGIVDAKNYKKKFSLSANLANHMSSEYLQKYEGYKDLDLEFFGYVAINKIGGEKKLEQITKNAKKLCNKTYKGFMITAPILLAYLDLCHENSWDKDNRINNFLKLVQNKAFDNYHDLKNTIIERI